MNTKKIFTHNLLFRSIAFAFFLSALGCTEERTITEEVASNEVIAIQSSTLKSSALKTFNFSPTISKDPNADKKKNIIQYEYDEPKLNIKNKTKIVEAAIKISTNSNEDINFAAWALAIAMQETKILTGNTGNEGTDTEYPWRDSKNDKNPNYPGPKKNGDASNFGIYKMNWYMIRNSKKMISKYGKTLKANDYGDYSDAGSIGNLINKDIFLATEILYDYYNTIKRRPNGTSADGNSSNNSNEGIPRSFWGGHRFGQTGWNNSNTDFKGGTIGINRYGWQDTINYWFAVKTATTILLRKDLKSFKKSNRRITHHVENI
jgi:hypothetical protein